MTLPTKRTVAYGVLIASVGLNASLALVDAWLGKYENAAVQAIFVVLLTAWWWLVPKIDGYLDARLAEALARQKTAELALAEFERLQRAGLLRVGVTTQARADRMH